MKQDILIFNPGPRCAKKKAKRRNPLKFGQIYKKVMDIQATLMIHERYLDKSLTQSDLFSLMDHINAVDKILKNHVE